MAKTTVILSQEEVKSYIDYQLIYQAMSSSEWDTEKKRTLWNEKFTEAERKSIFEMEKQARKWSLKNVPDKVDMSLSRLILWKKLEMFCSVLLEGEK